MHRTVSVSIKQPLRLKSLFFFALSVPVLFSQAEIPEWCRALPRPEYKVLQRVPISDRWFEVYKVAPAVFAIYEPHQSEEVISYLIVGDKRAALFDTGMGISDLKKVTSEMTQLPIVVLNSHTHNDHVGIIGGSTRSTPWIRTSPAKMREARVKTRKRKLDPVRFAASSRKNLI